MWYVLLLFIVICCFIVVLSYIYTQFNDAKFNINIISKELKIMRLIYIININILLITIILYCESPSTLASTTVIISFITNIYIMYKFYTMIVIMSSYDDISYTNDDTGYTS